ncbi:MAG: DUF4115 domain-containing protein [Limnochordia bacterium]|nr:DUF4115 domain-containing protein [Limnochordia bacterium]
MRELGDFLYQERQKKGITLEELEQITKIRSKYLRAIEEGDFEVIPGEVYLKGFLKSYAEAVGVEGRNVLAWYEQIKGPDSPPDTVAAESAATTEASLKELRRTRPSFGRALLVALLLIALAFLAYKLWDFYLAGAEQGETPNLETQFQQPEPEVEPEPATATPIVPEEQPESEPTDKEPEPVVTEPDESTHGTEVPESVVAVKLEVVASDVCWLEVYADGERVYYGNLDVDDARTFHGEKEIYAKFGKGEVASLRVNDVELGMAGKGVVRWLFTPEESKVVPPGETQPLI